MKSNQFIFIAGILFPIMVTAETIANPETEADRQMERIQEMAIPKPPEVGTSLLNGVKASLNEHTQTLTLDDLAKQPELAEPLLNQALQARNYIAAEQLLPIYRKWDRHDPILLDYAQGAIWRSQGKHKKAITLYRNILVRHPNLVAVRLDLAAMLYEDKQTRNSQHEFNTAKKQGLPEDVLPTIALYENAMGQNKWQFSGSLSYTQDNNINNVSAEREIHLPQFDNLAFEKNSDYLPQKGHGFTYALSVDRDINLKDNHYFALSGDVDGVSYWDNHDYDDQAAKVSLGYKNKSFKTDSFVMPFLEKRRYGNHPYYTRTGVDLGISRWIKPNLRLSANGTFAQKDYAYTKRQGKDYQIGFGATYLMNDKTYFLGGLNYARDKVENFAGSSSKRIGGYLGWGQIWDENFNSRLIINYYNERFDGKHYVFTDRHRTDNAVVTNLSLWHNKLSFLGITPRLNWRYANNNSNINELHSYTKNRVFIDFEKTF